MKRVAFFLILGVVCIFVGCSGGKTGDTGLVVLDISIQNEQGSSTTQALTRAPAPDSVTMVTISVTGLVEPVAIDINSLESSFEVPAGKDREFVTRAFNSANELIYHGAVKADIIAGEETRVSMILVSVSEPIETSMSPATVTVQPAYAEGTPTNITSYSIRVTSPLSTLITSQIYTPDSAIQVPSGEARLIELTAYSPTGDYSGTVTQNFAAGEVATVQVNMTMQNTAVTINLIGAPSNATLYTVTVTTSGETVLATQAFTPNTSIIQIAAGTARQFDIIAYSPAGDYSGSITQDLTAGESVTIAVTMQYADLTINPTLPLGTPTTSLGSYTVTITTSGSTAFTQTFTPGTAFRVPAKDAMNFEILVSTPSVTFRATSTQNLAANSSVTIAPNMSLYETQLVIPDGQNFRLVQIDDMIGTNWNALTALQIGYGDTFSALEDVDFDSLGRIIMANSIGSTGFTGIFRIDNILSTSYTSLVLETAVIGIAMDRVNNDLYYITSSSLSKIDLDTDCSGLPLLPCTSTTINISVFTNPYFVAIAVDEQGMLYLGDCAETTPSSELVPDQVVKFNPNTTSIITTYPANIDFVTTSFATHILGDIMIRAGSVYVANYGGLDNYKIVHLTSGLAFVQGYGTTINETSTSQGMFYGAHHFVGIRNDKFYIIDENYDTSNYIPIDKFISMDDMSGTNWTVSEPTSPFGFYYDC